MNFKYFATSGVARVGRTHCRLAWLTAMVATAIAIGPLDTAAAGSFSLDDNPSVPIASPPGVLPAPRVARSGPIVLDGVEPIPDSTDGITTEDLILLVKRRLDRLYQVLGRGN